MGTHLERLSIHMNHSAKIVPIVSLCSQNDEKITNINRKEEELRFEGCPLNIRKVLTYF